MLGRPVDPLSRAERFERVRAYLQALGLERHGAWVFGSVGRGDFTKGSDTGVLIVSDALPADREQGLDLIFDVRDVAPEIKPVPWLDRVGATPSPRAPVARDLEAGSRLGWAAERCRGQQLTAPQYRPESTAKVSLVSPLVPVSGPDHPGIGCGRRVPAASWPGSGAASPRPGVAGRRGQPAPVRSCVRGVLCSPVDRSLCR